MLGAAAPPKLKLKRRACMVIFAKFANFLYVCRYDLATHFDSDKQARRFSFSLGGAAAPSIKYTSKSREL